MTSALVIRRAEVADARLLAELGERTFRDTFAADNTPEDMASYLAQAFGEEIQRAELASSAVHRLLAERDTRALGYALLREGGESAGLVRGERPVELQRLYVESAAKGQGVAQALMARVEEEARARGGDVLWLGVWERNPRAIAFYRKCGFVDVGTHAFELGKDRQTDRVMTKPLAP
jgi:ribosomal protein S18 acetylase RimI-like enzyme